MSKKYPRFIIRTVRDGKIKFDGILWKPDTPTDRLNGKRFAFGVYPTNSERSERIDLLSLWGTEAVCRSEPLDQNEIALETALLAPDGYLRQEWWRPNSCDNVREEGC